MSAAYFTTDETESPLSLLNPADARKLRAKAWRHVRRINPATARRIWRAHNPRVIPKLKKRRKWGSLRLFDFSQSFYAAHVPHIGVTP